MTVLLFQKFGSYSINITILTPKNQRKLQSQMKKQNNNLHYLNDKHPTLYFRHIKEMENL